MGDLPSGDASGHAKIFHVIARLDHLVLVAAIDFDFAAPALAWIALA